jgi:hypothetical protein
LNIDTFSAGLIQSLTARGIDRQTASEYTRTLIRTLTEEDLREIAGYRTGEDFTALSESMAKLIQERTAPKVTVRPDMDTKVIRTPRPADAGTHHPLDGDMEHTRTGLPPIQPGKTAVARKAPDEMEHTKISVPVQEKEEHPLWEEEVTRQGFVPLTGRGKAVFWTSVVLTLPLTVTFSALLLFIFVLCFLTVCALIAASFLLIGGEVVAGTAGFLVGVIYGIIQICTTSAGIGIYEIGLGIICAGAALAFGVLTYYLATRGLPYILRQELLFGRYFLRQVKPMINRWREGVNKR